MFHQETLKNNLFASYIVVDKGTSGLEKCQVLNEKNIMKQKKIW